MSSNRRAFYFRKIPNYVKIVTLIEEVGLWKEKKKILD